MACIEKIYSVSAVVGGPDCDANCPGCAGKVLRGDARLCKEQSSAPRNIIAASRLALSYGAWSLALTSSGEPTLYPDAITDTLSVLRNANIHWPFINLFTNGIRLANDLEIQKLMAGWRDLGLTSIVLSIHNTDDIKNREAYGNPQRFYKLADAVNIIKNAGLCARIVLLLGRGNVDTLKEYVASLGVLKNIGVKLVTSWELRTNDGRRTVLTPSRFEMLKIRCWLMIKTIPVMGHVWGGMVRSWRGMNVRLTDYVSPHKARNEYIRQLVVLPGGKVSYSWYQDGMICLD